VIVGGLVVSQFITLFVTPVIYLYLEDFQEKVLDKTTMFHSGHSKLPSMEEIEAGAASARARVAGPTR
jgi:hypothetical protein